MTAQIVLWAMTSLSALLLITGLLQDWRDLRAIQKASSNPENKQSEIV